MSIGITTEEQKIIINILDKYKDYCFYFFGSRVKGTYEKTSDLDILIKGKQEIPLMILDEIKQAFDESKLPYIVNFSDYYSIDKDFYKRIKEDLFPYNWKEYTVQELIDIGFLEEPLDGNHGNIHPKTTDYVKSGVPFIMANDLQDGTINYANCVFITEKQASELKKGIAKPGDVLLTHKATIGRTAIVPNKYEKIVLTPQVTYYRIKKGILNTFLKYYFDSAYFQNTLNNWAGSGSTRAYLGILAQHKLPIVLPPLEIQQKIAKVLSVIDDKIELNNSINNNLEQQAQAMFKSWFIDFEPFGCAMPGDWKILKLENVCNISAGGDKPKEVSKIRTDKYSIPVYSNGIDNEGLYGYTIESKIVKESVTISARGTIGYTCLRLEPYVPIVRLIAVEPKDNKISAKYLYHAIKKMNIVGYGTTQQQITVPYCKMLNIIIPTQVYMDKFTTVANSIYKIIYENKKENLCLTQLRETLLPKLMSGEIDVSNVEIDNVLNNDSTDKLLFNED